LYWDRLGVLLSPGFGFWNMVGGSSERRSDDFMRIHSLTACGLYAGCTDLHHIHFLYIFGVDIYQNSTFAISIPNIFLALCRSIIQTIRFSRLFGHPTPCSMAEFQPSNPTVNSVHVFLYKGRCTITSSLELVCVEPLGEVPLN
jgi:hypothetical protein